MSLFPNRPASRCFFVMAVISFGLSSCWVDASNLLVGGDFDDPSDQSGWESSGWIASGSGSATREVWADRLNAGRGVAIAGNMPAADIQIRQTVSVTSNVDYAFSVWAKKGINYNERFAAICFDWLDEAGRLVKTATYAFTRQIAHDWQELFVYGRCTNSSVRYLQVAIHATWHSPTNADNASLMFDDAALCVQNDVGNNVDGLPDWWRVRYGLSSEPLTNALIGWWKLDETDGTNIWDVSGNNHHGGLQNTNGGQRVPGVVSNALWFQLDGGMRGLVLNTSSLSATGQAMAVCLWYRPESVEADYNQVILAKGGESSPNFYLGAQGGNRIKFAVMVDGETVTLAGTARTATYTDNWTHVTGVYDGDAVRLYLNGVDVTNTLASGNLVPNANSLTMGFTSPDINIRGRIDDIRIFRSALDSNDISRVMEAGVDADSDGLTNWEEYHWGSNPHNPDTDGDGLCDAEEVKWYFTDPLNPDTDGDGLPDGWEVTYGFNPAPLTNALISWWKMDEPDGTNIWDASGNSHHGVLDYTNGLARTPGVISNALYFAPGANARVNFGYVPTLNATGQTVTVCLWYRPAASTANYNQVILSKGPDTDPNYYVGAQWGNRITFKAGVNGEVVSLAGTARTATDTGRWAHVAGVYDGSAVRLYLDGVDVTNTPAAGDLTPNNGVTVMGHFMPEYNTRGRVDDVRVYRAALNSNEILRVMEAGMDHDGDGLTAWMEYQLGTDPHNMDSDGDGLADGEETFFYGTDPAKWDTDGDGMPDGWEVLHGLDPLSSADAALDADDDDASNLNEFEHATDPNDPNSSWSFDPAAIVWEPFPFRNHWQMMNQRIGGSAQMIIDIDWNLADRRVLYHVTDTTRIWKSMDRGNTWMPAWGNMQCLGGVSVVSDPRNPDVVYVAGMSNATNGPQPFDGIYRTLDGGLTWHRPAGVNVFFPKQFGGKLFLVDPDSYDSSAGRCLIVYAGCDDGIMRSLDGGDSWIRIASDMHVVDMEFSVADQTCIYVVTRQGLFALNTSTLVLTQPQASNLPGPPTINVSQWDIVVASKLSVTADVIYAATTNGIYKSEDGALSFVRMSDGLPEINGAKAYCRIALSQADPERLMVVPSWWSSTVSHALGSGPFWSTNGGQTWHQCTVADFAGGGDSFTAEMTWAFIRFHTKPVIFDPDNGANAMTQLGCGLGRADSAFKWSFLANGLAGDYVDDMFFPRPDAMGFTGPDLWIHWSADAGDRVERKFMNVAVPTADMRGDTLVWAARAPDGTNKIYRAVFTNQAYGSDLMPAHDYVATTGGLVGVRKIRFHPFNTNTVYLMHGGYGHFSTNQGVAWDTIGGGLGYLAALDPRHADVVYGWRRDPNSTAHSLVTLSTNHGVSGVVIGRIQLDQNAVVTDMAVDPLSTDSNVVLVTVRGGPNVMYRGWSTNLLATNWTWETVSVEQGFIATNNPFRVVFDPVRKGICWAGESGWSRKGVGILLSTNHGSGWIQVNNSLGPFANARHISVNPHNGDVYITDEALWRFTWKKNVSAIPSLRDYDGDGLPDQWEFRRMGTLAYGSDDDPDDDELSNLRECQINSDPLNPDTDGDGLPDGWKARYFGDLSQQPDYDPDNDGLGNAEEYAIGTSPVERDTDDDGMPDGDEVVAGTNPLNAGSFFEAAAGATSDDAYVVRWFSAPGRTYGICSVSNLPGMFVPLATNLTASPPENAYTDQVHGVEQRYYRISVKH